MTSDFDELVADKQEKPTDGYRIATEPKLRVTTGRRRVTTTAKHRLENYSAAIHTMPRLWRRWSVTLLLLLTAFGVVSGAHLGFGLQHDQTGLTYLLALIFAVILGLAVWHVVICERERATFDEAWQQRGSDGLPIIGGTWATGIYFQTLRQNLSRNQPPPLDRMAKVLAERMYHGGHLVGLGANVLITLGLIGTVIGLLISVQGLSSATTELAAQNPAAEQGFAMIHSLQEAISGMGTAFYTTLFGAILGGVIIRVLHGQTMAWIDLYASLVAECSDLELMPDYTEQLDSSVIMNALAREVRTLTGELGRLQAEIERLGGPKEMLERYQTSNEELLASLNGLRQQIDGLGPVAHAVNRLMGDS